MLLLSATQRTLRFCIESRVVLELMEGLRGHSDLRGQEQHPGEAAGWGRSPSEVQMREREGKVPGSRPSRPMVKAWWLSLRDTAQSRRTRLSTVGQGLEKPAGSGL